MSEIENLIKLKSEMEAALKKVSDELERTQYQEGLDRVINYSVPEALVLKGGSVELHPCVVHPGFLYLSFIGPSCESFHYEKWQRICRELEPLRPYWEKRKLGEYSPPFIEWRGGEIKIYAQASVVREWIQKSNCKLKEISNDICYGLREKIKTLEREIAERQKSLSGSQHSLEVLKLLKEQQSKKTN